MFLLKMRMNRITLYNTSCNLHKQELVLYKNEKDFECIRRNMRLSCFWNLTVGRVIVVSLVWEDFNLMKSLIEPKAKIKFGTKGSLAFWNFYLMDEIV